MGLFPKMLQGKEGQVQVKLALQKDFASSPYWEHISSLEELSPLRNRHLDFSKKCGRKEDPNYPQKSGQ